MHLHLPKQDYSREIRYISPPQSLHPSHSLFLEDSSSISTLIWSTICSCFWCLYSPSLLISSPPSSSLPIQPMESIEPPRRGPKIVAKPSSSGNPHLVSCQLNTWIKSLRCHLQWQRRLRMQLQPHPLLLHLNHWYDVLLPPSTYLPCHSVTTSRQSWIYQHYPTFNGCSEAEARCPFPPLPPSLIHLYSVPPPLPVADGTQKSSSSGKNKFKP